jgi:hypothetical protein
MSVFFIDIIFKGYIFIIQYLLSYTVARFLLWFVRIIKHTVSHITNSTNLVV